ncbi:hypothetical protein EGW08_012462 [Elysia chlorotica]|uniref:Uncharacterized protein n=1 Tax=Elysia chlorotica TaxID=188477 RepID=A0A3S0ZIL7_ELYCH|nr:hypothetical protein EGW08_012462 [Elysia chlorotica]
MLKSCFLARQAALNMLGPVTLQQGLHSFSFLHRFWMRNSLLSFPSARQFHQRHKVKQVSIPFKNWAQTLLKTLHSETKYTQGYPQSFWQRHYSESVKSTSEDSSNLYSLSVDSLLSEAHIRRLAVKLSCKVAEVKSLVKGYAFLIHMDFHLLEGKVNLLLSYNLPVSFVREHLRIVYQASEKVLEERLELLKDSGLLHSHHLEIDKLAHLLECNGTEFAKSFKYRCDQRDALEGCYDQLAYLQMRLACSKEKAQSLLGSYPLERHVSNVKLKRLLDFFLVEVERSPDFVISYRKLLTFSVSRLQNRWRVMQAAGIESEAEMVYVWCMSQKEFEKQYSEHLKSSNSSSSSAS